MKSPIPLLVAGLVTACLHAQSPYSALEVPKQIQYQGRVTTGTGGAWTGTEGYFAFALVQGATVLWNNWEGTASPSDPGTVSLGAGQVLTLPVGRGVFSLRVGEGTDTNEQIPPTVFFDTVSNSVRTGVKLAVWFSPDGGTFTRLGPDVEFTSVPYAMVAGISETVKERAVTTTALADESVTSEKIKESAVTTAALADEAVTALKLGLASITGAQLAPDAVTPDKISPEMAIFKDLKAYGVHGGVGPNATWLRRVLNTVEYNGSSSISLNPTTSVVTLQPGSYYLRGYAPAHNPRPHRAAWYNLTSSSFAILGSNEAVSDTGLARSTRSIVEGVVTVPAGGPHQFELRHWMPLDGNGLDLGHSSVVPGLESVYSVISIFKIR